MASLDEPYVLSSYSVEAKAGSSWQVGVTALVDDDGSEKVSQNSKSKASGKSGSSRRSIAVNTVQRSGIHLVDLVDQSPLSSFTVSPNVIFTAKAVSVSYPSPAEVGEASTSTASTSNSQRTRKTFAAVEQEARYELWLWTESENRDGSSSGEATKQVLSLESKAASVDVASLENHLLVVCENGQMLVLDFDLQEVAQTRLAASSNLSRGTFSASQASRRLPFLGLSSASEGAVILPYLSFSSSSTTAPNTQSKKAKRKSIATDESKITGRVSYLTFDITSKKLGTSASCEIPGDDIVDAAFLGSTGVVIALHQSGELVTYQVASSASEGYSAQPISQPLQLRCTVTKSLLLSTTQVSPKQAILLALDASETISVTSSFFLLGIPKASSKDTIHVFLFDARYGLILAEQSVTIASAGSAETSPLNLTRLDGYNIGLAYTSAPGGSEGSTTATTRRGIVQALPCSVPTQSSLADMIGKQALTQRYLAEGASETNLAKKLGQQDEAAQVEREKLLEQLRPLLGSDKATDRNVSRATEVFKAWFETHGRDKSSPLPTSFVTLLLSLALVRGKPHLPVASGILSTLVTSSLAADSSCPEPGLVASLLPTNEWSTILSCLKQLSDIPETSLVAALRQADTSKGTELHTVLRAVVKCPVTQAELRKAIKTGLEVQELEAILKICEAWLGDQEEKEKLRYGRTPGTAYVVPFLQTVMDAHLVTLLQTRSLHPLLRSLSNLLNEQIAMSFSVLSLRGPLAEINKIHQTQLAEAKERKARLKKLGSKNADGSAGRSRKLKDDPEERWKAKIRQQESTMMVGEYALEEFKL